MNGEKREPVWIGPVEIATLNLEDDKIAKKFGEMNPPDPLLVDHFVAVFKEAGEADGRFKISRLRKIGEKIFENPPVIDGRQRIEGARQAGLAVIWCQDWAFDSLAEATEYAFNCERRRHRSDAAFLFRVEALTEAESPKAAERQKAGETLSSNELKGPTAEIVAKKLGVSPAKVKRAQRVLKDKKLADQVKRGKQSIGSAHKKLRSGKPAGSPPPDPGKPCATSEQQISGGAVDKADTARDEASRTGSAPPEVSSEVVSMNELCDRLTCIVLTIIERAKCDSLTDDQRSKLHQAERDLTLFLSRKEKKP